MKLPPGEALGAAAPRASPGAYAALHGYPVLASIGKTWQLKPT